MGRNSDPKFRVVSWFFAKNFSKSKSLFVSSSELNSTDSLDRSNRMGGAWGVTTFDSATSFIAFISQVGGTKLSSGPGIALGKNSSIVSGR